MWHLGSGKCPGYWPQLYKYLLLALAVSTPAVSRSHLQTFMPHIPATTNCTKHQPADIACAPAAGCNHPHPNSWHNLPTPQKCHAYPKAAHRCVCPRCWPLLSMSQQWPTKATGSPAAIQVPQKPATTNHAPAVAHQHMRPSQGPLPHASAMGCHIPYPPKLYR